MIQISKDKLYKLIKELKELKLIIPAVSKGDLLKRFKIKVQTALLDRILDEEGIDKLLAETKSNKNSRLLVDAVVEEAKNEE